MVAHKYRQAVLLLAEENAEEENNPEVQRAPVVQVTNMAAEDDSDIPGRKKNSFLQQIEAVSC